MSTDLRKLLAEWKLESILPHLIAEEIDIDTLEMMKTSHIRTLLSNYPLGIQIRFEHNLEQWRYKVGKPLKFYLNNDAGQTLARNSIENNTERINLKQILMQCVPDGLELIDIYRRNQTFSMAERSHLINIIVNYYLHHKLSLNLYTSYNLENAILAMFPNERLDLYRTGVVGKIYEKYLTSNGAQPQETEENNENALAENCNGDQNLSNHDTEEDLRNNSNANTDAMIPNVIILQTVYKGVKRFVTLVKPFLLENFLQNASILFNMMNKNEVCVAVNECEIAENDFQNVILQYYKLSSFVIEIKDIDTPMTKVEQFEDSSNYSYLENTTTNMENTTYSENTTYMETTTSETVYNSLPDANDIRNIPSLLFIVKISDDGKPLENKHRTVIAKALIDECLRYQPDRLLKRQDFLTLTDNILKAFPNEVASTYYIPSQMQQAARGKLWNAYNNKRSFLGSSGILQRRHRQMKRKRQLANQEEADDEKTNDNTCAAAEIRESKDFAWYTTQNMETLKEKWSNCHRVRRNELLKHKLTPYQYMQKYSILKTDRGIELIELDVNTLYPTVANVSNWLSLYGKVIEMARKLRKIDKITEILQAIEASSSNEKYSASLALLLVPYILPYNARRNDSNGEKATKSEIQKRFIKDYHTLGDLISDASCNDLQIRFVHTNGNIIYAEFNVCGHLFKSANLLEALNAIFHYIMALNIEYPKMCLHIWQFIQLAIFQIEIQGCIQPNVQSFINDLYMT